MSYIKNNFLLTNCEAERLYFDYAKKMPIFDYHCHLSEVQILENKPFTDIYEIWLAGDHYKWRLMRNFGVDERYITGNATNEEKFLAYCSTLGTAFGNPLYHWSQLELAEFFDCHIEINAENARKIWKSCNDYISKNVITPEKLITQANVSHLFTTNEIFDDLSTFKKIKEKKYAFKVIPAFRADKILNIEAQNYNEFVDKLGGVSNLSDLEEKIEERLRDFISVGTTAADIALQSVYPVGTRHTAEEVFEKRLGGESVSDSEMRTFKGYLTYFLFKLYAKYGIATELHIGAMRNNNTKMYNSLGADTGFDSIASDEGCIHNMSRLFDRLNDEDALPKTIVFNLNPKMNTEIMTLIGSFQSSEACGKIQYGPAWWFLDNKVGMEKHLDDLVSTGHIASFVGMLTDSRSFLSYPRHHYFRRILCNFLGTMIANGEITANMELVGSVVRDICYNNAIKYFKM